MGDTVIVSPGPVHVAPEAWKNLQALHHRSGEFRNIVRECRSALQELLHTSSPVYLLTSSGTGAMEAAVANVTVPGSRVLVVSGGKFGRRWAEIFDAYECRTSVLRFEDGAAIDVDSVVERIDRERPEFVALTHVESSTGLLFPLRELSRRLRGERSIMIVDAISSLGAEDFLMDEWRIDVAIGASQKSLAAPPGVSFAAVGKRALGLVGRRSKGVYYFDFNRAGLAAVGGDTPFTPAIGTIQIMHRSLRSMRALGFDKVILRHRTASGAFLRAAGHLSLESFAKNPSSAVQVLVLPRGCPGERVLAGLARQGFVAADGQDDLRGRVVRTGFLGLHGPKTLERLVSALGGALRECGAAADVAAAMAEIRDANLGDFSWIKA
ncbi:MAG: aminotransferase class V-fold PLP-dependent enzyme [Candidatus Krumholzibacteria bacterium]|nr:aminotransferase class V-fold PLP-dependent enzyme [Candidatus Krumholzibacteria bacterium]